MILQALDDNRDGKLSVDEIERATAALKQLDRNKDGELTVDELQLRLQTHLRRPTISRSRDEQRQRYLVGTTVFFYEVHPALLFCADHHQANVLGDLRRIVDRRRRPVVGGVNSYVKSQAEGRFDDMRRWKPILESAVDREHCVLHGTTHYAEIGGLFAGWPNCRVALVVSPNHFALIPGPYTKRGVAATLLTLLLELSLSRLPGSNTDEFIQIAENELARANQFIAFTGLMQQTKTQS